MTDLCGENGVLLLYQCCGLHHCHLVLAVAMLLAQWWILLLCCWSSGQCCCCILGAVVCMVVGCSVAVSILLHGATLLLLVL